LFAIERDLAERPRACAPVFFGEDTPELASFDERPGDAQLVEERVGSAD
jgi:hypothetical protein